MRLRPTDRVLVRLPSWLGDFVMAEPAMAGLARALEDGRCATLTFAAPERFLDLIEGRFAGVRRVAPNGDWSGHDVALFLDGSLRSLLYARRAGIRERISGSSGARFLLATESLRPAMERGGVPLGLGRAGHVPRRLPRPFGATCAELVGLCGVAIDARAPRLASSRVARDAVSARLEALGLKSGEPYILLDASARERSAKAAPPELWAAVLRELAPFVEARIVLATAPGEQALAHRVLELAPASGALLFDAPPPTLAELLALVEGCQVFLGCDSGPRHLATACGKPQVILMGPSDPRHTADHNGATQVLRRVVECGPCHRERCSLSAPDTGHCLSGLSATAVVDAVKRSAAQAMLGATARLE